VIDRGTDIEEDEEIERLRADLQAYRDAMGSFVSAIQALVKAEDERDAALAAIGRVRALLHPDNPLRAIGVREADIQAALEDPS